MLLLRLLPRRLEYAPAERGGPGLWQIVEQTAAPRPFWPSERLAHPVVELEASIRPCAMCSCKKATAWSRSASPMRGSTGRVVGSAGCC